MDKNYKTRDGREVRVLCVDNKQGGKWTVVAVVGGEVSIYTKEGIHSVDFELSGYDLVETPEEKELWLEIFSYNNFIDGIGHNTKSMLMESISDSMDTSNNYKLIATKHITYIEGESCL